MRARIAAIDVFCGCGGMTRGLLDAGIRVLLGVDIDGKVQETYEKNNPPTKFFHRNVRETHGSDLMTHVRRSEWDYLLLAGCAPCQPYSSMRKRRERRKQANLLSQFGRLVREALPDAILVENVPGLMGIRGRRIWDRFVRQLGWLGYVTDSRVVDAKDYGVPQTRKRLLLVAGRGLPIKVPPPTHGPMGTVAREYETVRRAIGHYPPLAAGESSPNIRNHAAPSLTAINLARIRLIPKDGGSRAALPRRYVLRCHRNTRCHTDTYGRMAWDKPAPTLTCRCTGLSNGRFGHPSQDRAISVREAAALQTFPDSYVFPGGIGYATGLIGNAVPVRLARFMGEAVVDALAARAAERLTVSPQSRTERRPLASASRTSPP